MKKIELNNLISQRESEQLEIKSNFGSDVVQTLVAFANSRGGEVYIGISDHNRILGVDIQPETVQNWINEIKSKTTPQIIPEAEVITIENKSVIVFKIQEYPIKPVSTRGRYYKRVHNSNHLLSTSEVVDMHLQSFNTSWDYHLNSEYSVKEISLNKVQAVIDSLNSEGTRVTEDPLSFLVKHDLIRNGSLTNAAYLLFKERLSVMTTVELGRFQDDITIKDSHRTKDDILTQVDQIMSFVQKHINKEVVVTGEARNVQRWQYPLEAIRETVMNMIVHRDYRSSSDSILKIYDSKIEFYNPGCLPQSITVNDLLSNNYKSVPRNKLIADFFKSIGLIEKYGSGIRRILDGCKKAGLPNPEFKNISDGFMVTFFSKEAVSGGQTGGQAGGQTGGQTGEGYENIVLTSHQKMIIELIESDNRVTRNELSRKLNINESAIQKHITKLKKLGIIKRIGHDFGGYWQIQVPPEPH